MHEDDLKPKLDLGEQARFDKFLKESGCVVSSFEWKDDKVKIMLTEAANRMPHLTTSFMDDLYKKKFVAETVFSDQGSKDRPGSIILRFKNYQKPMTDEELAALKNPKVGKTQ